MSQVLSQGIEAAYRERFPTSAKLYKRGLSLFPSGVTHDGRFLKPFPIYVDRAQGSRKHDVDGHEIVDYWMGHGALLLGHSHPAVVDAVRKQVPLSTHPGACHELELEWGELVRQLKPSCEMMRFTNSGTEATLMALRIVRICTGKTKIVKFAGHFHGWHDALIPAAEPPHDTGDYHTPGVTDGVFGDLVIVPPNDIDAVARAIDEHDPCCVIHEGNGARWGVAPVREDFMQSLRQLTADKGVIFILDEVITGFRCAPGGFQEYCGITPDLTSMAKVLAGGLPGGCLGGRADLMQALAFDNPLGRKMKHPGTYNANPLSAAAGIAALKLVATGEPCDQANESACKLRAALNELFEHKSLNWIAYGDFSAIKILPDYDGPRPSNAMGEGLLTALGAGLLTPPTDRPTGLPQSAGDLRSPHVARSGDRPQRSSDFRLPTSGFVPYEGDYRQLDCKFDSALSHAFRCALLLGGVDWMGWAGSTSSAHTDEDVDRTVIAFTDAIDMLREDGLIG